MQPETLTNDTLSRSGHRLIDLTVDAHAWALVHDVAAAMAPTVNVDGKTLRTVWAETADRGLAPVPDPPTKACRRAVALPATDPRDRSGEPRILAAALVELAHHLVDLTRRRGAPPDLLTEVVDRALDHFHPTAMHAALDVEPGIHALLRLSTVSR